jgi:hypothetical protein
MKMNKESYYISEGSTCIAPKADWRLTIGAEYQIFYREGNQPNRFHRWMQKVFFGFNWEKMDE